jgi:transcriptional regulator with GAF, ATPase, and Fis domain
MQIRAIIYKAENPDYPIRMELNFDQPVDVENIRQHSLPRAYLATNEDLNHIRKFKDLIVDRGVKHKAKGLSKLLLGHELFPMIEGNFDSERQLGRSIRTLLTNALKNEDQNAYFIGISRPIFEQVWDNAESNNKNAEPVVQFETAGSRSIENFPDVTTWMVNELSQRCQVPESLKKRYVGVSHDTMLVRQKIVLAANCNYNVLITGDTGTGKELVAKQIHSLSSRKEKKFLAINCGGISTTLFESELFGHVKGAFTGATKDKEGLWKVAGEGTLFLDEIGDLHFDSQVKILRALEEQSIRPVGSVKSVAVKARVIAATNRKLLALIEKGLFRKDLFYRLNVFPIVTPDLRHHVEDIPVIAEFLWRQIATDIYKPLPKEIVEYLKSYSWPGNVRELKMVLQNLHSLFGSTNLNPDHLKGVFLFGGQSTAWQHPATMAEKDFEGSVKKNIEQVAATLYHLKRSQEVIRSLELQFEQFKANDKKSLDIAFKFGMYDLESLCRQPSLFGDSFAIVWHLLESLNRYQESFHIEINEINELESQLSATFITVQTSLAKAIKQLVQNLL